MKVKAENSNGWSEYSEANTAGPVVHTEPQQMQAISIDFQEVSNIAVTLRWTALTGSDTGGLDVDVDSYELQWRQGTDTWADLITLAATELSYTHSPPLSGGETYGYRIRAVNEYGSAELYSEETQILTA